MSPRFLAVKGALYIGAGAASPLLFADLPVMAIIQTIALIAMGSLNLYRAFQMMRV